jgi:hypothetical protein
MFYPESAYQNALRKLGPQQALRFVGDIHPLTKLYGPKDKPKGAEPSLLGQNLVLDINTHFLELSNPGEYQRSTISMIWMLFTVGISPLTIASIDFLWGLEKNTKEFGDIFAAICGLMLTIGGYVLLYLLRPKEAFLTALRARYRFNRTTGKVYIVRPPKFGGNAVLDFSRVKAHVQWRKPLEGSDHEANPTPERHQERLDQFVPEHSHLMLYWPPLDPNDPQRRGEDLIFVGAEIVDAQNTWEYIRTFMNKGMQAVPLTQGNAWLRKGFSTPVQLYNEVLMQPFTTYDQMLNKAPSASTQYMSVSSLPQALSHTLAERLCYWPTFPIAWNSDCGQPRREDGIGAEVPQDWQASGPAVQGEIFANECTQHSHPTTAQWRSMLLWCTLHIAIAVAILVVPIALAVQASGR